VLVEELGEDWRSKFKEFEVKPIAAASIGQVSIKISLSFKVVMNLIIMILQDPLIKYLHKQFLYF
jgi:hypothetical protein